MVLHLLNHFCSYFYSSVGIKRQIITKHITASSARNTRDSEIKTMKAVLEVEVILDNSPVDVSQQKIGYDS